MRLSRLYPEPSASLASPDVGGCNLLQSPNVNNRTRTHFSLSSVHRPHFRIPWTILLLEVTLALSLCPFRVDWPESHRGNAAVGSSVAVFLERVTVREEDDTKEGCTVTHAEEQG